MLELASPVRLEIVLILTIGSALATIFGYLTEKSRLSPILGYLLAGYIIGPYSPGFVANVELSEKLAEIGVILMMFWVGLHIKWRELFFVKGVAITGAIGQTCASTLVGVALARSFGWSFESALVIGFGLSIASTVVLVRLLAEKGLHSTQIGHISLGWLIFEDLIAVFALLLLPTLASTPSGQAWLWDDTLLSLTKTMIKFTIWVCLLFTIGRRVISFIMEKINATQSHELFTLAVLSLTFSIAVGSAFFTGTSIALGAFIAGMVLGKSQLQHQISTTLVSMRDAFVVFFFLSIGMLFNPAAVLHNTGLFLGMLAVILLLKPLVALGILRLWKIEIRASLVSALALAQIGEFSFILAEEANKLNILPDDGFDVLVACSFISLAVNPLLVSMAARGFAKGGKFRRQK